MFVYMLSMIPDDLDMSCLCEGVVDRTDDGVLLFAPLIAEPFQCLTT